MGFTVFLGNLPVWVTKDDILSWLRAENLVADDVKVIRNPETQESKGFAFIDAPNGEEMNAIIRRFDRAPLEDRLLRANPAQPPKPKGGQVRPGGVGPGAGVGPGSSPASGHGPGAHSPSGGHSSGDQRGPRRHKKSSVKRAPTGGPQSAFAEELAKVL